MKHMHTDKYTIAWFKIAECVSRGEKERALGVYRLLSHSFNDDAVARQLEGDIYLSCNELDRALFLYTQAMELYEKSQRILEAAAVGEHLIFLCPDDSALQKKVFFYYSSLTISWKMSYFFKSLAEVYLQNNQLNVLNELLDECEKKITPLACAELYQECISLVHAIPGCSDITIQCIERVIFIFSDTFYDQNLQEFFSFLATIDHELYEYAVAYMQKK